MNKIRINFLAVFLLLLILADFSFSQDLIQGARPMSLGNAFNSVDGDVNSLFNNIAGIASIQKNMLDISSMPAYIVDQLYYFRMGYIFPYFNEKLGIGLTRDFIPGFYQVNDLSLGMGYVIIPNLLTGIRLKYIFSSITLDADKLSLYNSNLNYFTFDLGSIYKVNKYLDVSILGNNLTNPIVSFAKNPGDITGSWNITTGLKLNVLYFLFFTLDEEFQPGQSIILRAGSELSLFDEFSMRFGINENNMLSFGLGLNLTYFIFDFGLMSHSQIGNQYQIDLTFCY